VTLFETETMAELCIKQGHPGEGLAIYRRLLEEPTDAETRARRRGRIAELEAQGARPDALGPEEPAVKARRRADELDLEWSLPTETRQPALQLLLMRRPSPAAGIETETRTIPLAAPAGRMTVGAPGLYAALVAVGFLQDDDANDDGKRFVPLARLLDGAL
jgi:hypothetical protein